MPNTSAFNELLSKALGYPSLVIRIQAPILMRMLCLGNHEVVLDAGCGSGFFTSEIAPKSQLSVGIDLKLKARLALALNKHPKKVYLAADMTRLPFAEKKFDKILLSSVLQMVNDASLLEECFRVLKADGQIILSVPLDYCYFKKLNDYKVQLGIKADSKGKAYYTPQQVMEVLNHAGFQVVESEFSPKKWGSLVTEMEIYLWHKFKLPFLSSICFPLFYFLLYLERKANRADVGDQLLIKAQKYG
jgi:ubiquinone/menaquinone biosynthesis C-methylase UbiE